MELAGNDGHERERQRSCVGMKWQASPRAEFLEPNDDPLPRRIDLFNGKALKQILFIRGKKVRASEGERRQEIHINLGRGFRWKSIGDLGEPIGKSHPGRQVFVRHGIGMDPSVRHSRQVVQEGEKGSTKVAMRSKSVAIPGGENGVSPEAEKVGPIIFEQVDRGDRRKTGLGIKDDFHFRHEDSSVGNTAIVAARPPPIYPRSGAGGRLDQPTNWTSTGWGISPASMALRRRVRTASRPRGP